MVESGKVSDFIMFYSEEVVGVAGLEGEFFDEVKRFELAGDIERKIYYPDSGDLEQFGSLLSGFEDWIRVACPVKISDEDVNGFVKDQWRNRRDEILKVN